MPSRRKCNLIYNCYGIVQKFIKSGELKGVLISLSTILIYYCFSIVLTFYNRNLFVTYKYPLSITLIHLILKFCLASLLRSVLNFFTRKKFRPSENGADFLVQTKRITLDWSAYLKRIVPTGIASVGDIGFSNWSLQYITISLYTMSKSTAILFIFFFSILFKLEKWVNNICLFIDPKRFDFYK
jgi:solute carrier family 35 protein C2